MPDKTEEERLVDSPAPEPDRPAGEIIPATDDTVPITPIQEPENMEVHHHTHHDHGKRNWRSYFWEFLMLFLAVFCGFLAEYQLEHQIEKQRAKEFAQSLYRDISADTLAYNMTSKNLNISVANIDSLLRLLGNKAGLGKNTAAIYQLSVYAFIFPQNKPNESTLQQLLNSGSLRYFRSSGLIDSVKEYNNEIQLYNDFRQDIGAINIEFRKIQARIMESNPLVEMVMNNTFYDLEKITIDAETFAGNAKLVTNDPLLIKEYASWCALKKFYMFRTGRHMTALKQRARAVLWILKDEYHFE